MEYIEKIRTHFHFRFLEKQITTFNIRRTSISLQEAKYIGILFDGTSESDRPAIMEFVGNMKKSGKMVDILGFLNQNTIPGSEPPFEFFDKKKLDWAFRPVSKEVIDFQNQNFDMLLNLSCKSVVPLDYIAACSHARFRVGPFVEGRLCYDLMLDCGQSKDVKHFIQQIVSYLGKMQSKPEKKESLLAV